MLVYALNKAENKALTIGVLFWFGSREIKDMTTEEILQVCRPVDPKCREAFDMIYTNFKSDEIVLKNWLPENCKVIKGYWETEHAR
jgi:hypothetical protein